MDKKWKSSIVRLLEEMPEIEQFNNYFLRHIHLSKQHCNQDFTCDHCQQEFHQSSLFSLAWTPAELPHHYTYCADCLKRMPHGLNHWKKITNQKDMKKTKKKIFKTETKKKISKKILPVEIKPTKQTSSYYLCMGTNCHGQNITKVAKECKSNAPTLLAQRAKKVKELAKAAKVIGKFAQELEKVLAH